jgi:hypothetical protein
MDIEIYPNTGLTFGHLVSSVADLWSVEPKQFYSGNIHDIINTILLLISLFFLKKHLFQVKTSLFLTLNS